MPRELLHVAIMDGSGERIAVYRDVDGVVRASAYEQFEQTKPFQQIEQLSEFDSSERVDPPPRDFSDIFDPLKRVFGYDEFREGQQTLVEGTLAGRDALGVMPTGSGKSICFQLPALLLPGVTLVISPLISLMRDQVNALIQSGVRAAYLNSSLTERQFERALDNAKNGAYKLIYIAPERLLTPRFLEFASHMDIPLVAVDEAHCISQWGQDFRPSYLSIPDFIDSLPRRPSVCGYTATATERVRADIKKLLRLNNPLEIVTGFDRANLFFSVERPQDKKAELMRIVRANEDKSGIVYCATRKSVEDVCAFLQRNGVSSTRYHAGLDPEERTRNQEDFAYDRARVMVATNAFGMGIDKSDVRFVVHYNMPKDIESYYQEAGRAGRDGARADCILLFNRGDVVTQQRLIELGDGNERLSERERGDVMKSAYERLTLMVKYAQTRGCLRQSLLGYFGERAGENCGFCANCIKPLEMRDVTDIAGALIRAVRETGGYYGVRQIVDMLRGRETSKIKQYRLNQSRLFGSLAKCEDSDLTDIADQLVEMDYLAQENRRMAGLSLGERAMEVLTGEGRVLARVNREPEPGGETTPRLAPRERSRSRADKTEMMSDEVKDLFQQLRALRSEIAAKQRVPAYFIFADATLLDMCQKLPATREAMLSVSGVGQAKMNAYGTIFLEKIAEWMKEKE